MQLYLCLVLVLAAAYVSDAISCFKCNGIAFPRDCPFVVQCGPHEQCFVDQLVSPDGNIKYDSGCRDRQICKQPAGRKRDDAKRQGVTGDLVTCTACCDADHCNYGGCGEPGLPDRSRRGPICYDCYQQREEAGCNQVKICGLDEKCHIMRSPNTHFDFAYTTGCINNARCKTLSILGKRDADDDVVHQKRGAFCFHCCDDELCNKDCSGANSSTPLSTSPTPLSSSTTTASTSKSTSTKSSTMSSTTKPATTSTTQQTTTSTTTKIWTTVGAATNTHKCSSNTVRYNNHCYYFSTEIKYWEEARQLCKGRNGYLVKIEDINEQLFLEKKLIEFNTAGQIPASVWGYYIGAHLVQGNWLWSDGTPVVFSDWGRDEPDHPDFQIFGMIFMPGHYAGNYKWGSHSDMQGTSRFICEIELH